MTNNEREVLRRELEGIGVNDDGTSTRELVLGHAQPAPVGERVAALEALVRVNARDVGRLRKTSIALFEENDRLRDRVGQLEGKIAAWSAAAAGLGAVAAKILAALGVFGGGGG